jgi:hypothetical protein
MGAHHLTRQESWNDAAAGCASARLQDPELRVSFELLHTGPHLCVERRVAVAPKVEFTCYASFGSEEAFSKWSAKDHIRLTHPHLHHLLLRAAVDVFAKAQSSPSDSHSD